MVAAQAKAVETSILAASVKEVAAFAWPWAVLLYEFACLPWPLKELGFWKATELRSFLLYLDPVVLKGILQKRKYER